MHGIMGLGFGGHNAILAPTFAFNMALLQLMLGVGFVAGVCSTPLEPHERIYEALFWTNPVQCDYPNGNGFF